MWNSDVLIIHQFECVVGNQKNCFNLPLLVSSVDNLGKWSTGLDPDQAWQNISPDLPEFLKNSLKKLIKKKVSR